MAVKQNGVLATFTPTVSDYTNNTVAANNNAVATNGWCMYTCPTATLVSGKIIVSNNTGGAVNIDIGIVEQTDVIQLDALASQPGAPDNYGAFAFPSGTPNDYASSIAIEYGNLSGTINAGETISWTNSNLPSAFQSVTAIVHYHDTGNAKLWLRNMSHPLGLNLTTNTNFTASGGGTFSVGSSYAGTSTNAGWSGWLRFYDSLQGTLFLQNWEFRNNLDYQHLYANDANENRQQNNNNLARSNGRVWRPVTTTTPSYDNAGNTTNPVTKFVDVTGKELLVSAVSSASAEQYVVRNKSIADASTFELTGVVLGAYQSIFVSSTAAVTFSLIGFEETAEALS